MFLIAALMLCSAALSHLRFANPLGFSLLATKCVRVLALDCRRRLSVYLFRWPQPLISRNRLYYIIGSRFISRNLSLTCSALHCGTMHHALEPPPRPSYLVHVASLPRSRHSRACYAPFSLLAVGRCLCELFTARPHVRPPACLLLTVQLAVRC